MTTEELLKLSKGTKVRIKEGIECADVFKGEQEIAFQKVDEIQEGEFEFGLKTNEGYCWQFNAEDYEVV